METQLERRFKIQKWTNVALCALVIFFGLGFCSSNKSLYLKAITEALGFKRSDYALATSCRFIATAVINIFFGYLVKKFGSYAPAYFIAAAIMTGVLIVTQVVISSAHRTRNVILAKINISQV